MEQTGIWTSFGGAAVPEKVGTEVLKSHNNKTNLKLLLLISLMLVTITTAITTMTMTMKIP